jgi:thiamine monophosphate synthase
VYALGGLNPRNAGRVLDVHPLHGIAVMGDVMRADDPARQVERLLRDHGALAP